MAKLKFLEFFAGAGMARLGLGSSWTCCFANDVCPKKAAAYRANFKSADELFVADINDLNVEGIPDGAHLAWASFPCQDLSLAGAGRGFLGTRSSTFWPFHAILKQKALQDRPIPIIVLENVIGALSSNNGEDYRAIATALAELGYKFGSLVIDAKYFVAQSRPRLFIVAVKESVEVPNRLLAPRRCSYYNNSALDRATAALQPSFDKVLLNWHLPPPESRSVRLADVIVKNPPDVKWHTVEETRKLLSMMSPQNLEKLNEAQSLGRPIVGTIYKRTREDADGTRRQRAEVRFDQISGCIRTPAGGSSRQVLVFVHGNDVKSRLISGREIARLMGVPDSYRLPSSYNEAYHLMGDGVVVDVVRELERHLLRPLAKAAANSPRSFQVA